ncbi:MAG: hypothetical protein QNJ98_08800 [Planctomycetota bacterium]|nr:hypothetical protein [Planctomycetota bacterium]
MTPAAHRTFGIVATLVVLGAIAWGFWIVGSPESRRVERLDERRIDDLQAIVWEIQRQVIDPSNAKRMERELPATLEALAAKARYRELTLVDPETGTPYEYEIVDAHTYRLCATFARARDRKREIFWNHPAGRHCFTIDVYDAP